MYKIPKELSFIGDTSYALDSEFRITSSKVVRGTTSGIFTGFIAGSDILAILDIKQKQSEIEKRLKEENRWNGQISFEGNNLFLQIIPLARPTVEKYYASISFVLPEEKAGTKKDTLLHSSELLDGFFWQSKTAIKDSETYYSPGAALITGYYSSEINNLPGKYLSIIFYDDTAYVMKQFSDFSLNPSADSLELIYRIIRKDGELRWVKENISGTNNPGHEQLVYIGIVSDITKLKEYEAKLLESEARLLEINQAKDRFINILSHDLRAPFTSILGFAEILINEVHLPTAEKNEYLNYIYEASQNQLQFISYLLDWSRLRTGTLKIETQRIQLQALVYNCVSILTGNAIRKNIQINVDVNEKLYMQADERLITQVILNLLSNAIKFSFENGVIEISAVKFNEEQVELVVKDYGAGIATEDQPKIFSIEKNYSKEGTKGEKGSGFGLALVKEIINKHGGEAWFYSELEKGSEFHFTVPLPSNTILIVQNDEDEMNLITSIINDVFPEFLIITSENGYEAISMVASQTPNLIITNHQMPLMNGIQFIEALKRSDSDLKIPLIILTEYSSPETEALYYKLGVKTVINKNADSTELTASLKKILQ